MVVLFYLFAFRFHFLWSEFVGRFEKVEKDFLQSFSSD